MTNITLAQIKKLRSQTGAGIMACRQALEIADADEPKAKKWLREKGWERAVKRADHLVRHGLIETYSHADGQIVSVVELLCETDFVARTQDFRQVAHELALQVAAMRPQNRERLLKQVYIRENTKTIQDLISELVSKIGEKIQIGRFARWEIGEENYADGRD
jgi:elongation factor Ts